MMGILTYKNKNNGIFMHKNSEVEIRIFKIEKVLPIQRARISLQTLWSHKRKTHIYFIEIKFNLKQVNKNILFLTKCCLSDGIM